MPRLTDVQKGEIIALCELGLSIGVVAGRLGWSKSVVYRWWVRWQEEGHVRVRPVPGRHRVTTPAQDAQIIQLSTDNHFLTSKQIKGQLHLNICERTVRRRLAAAGLYARWAAKKEMMTDAQREIRLNFAHTYVDHPEHFWRRLVWTDEKCFQSSLSGRFVVYRRRGRRHHPDYVKRVARSGRFSVCIWVWISWDGVGMMWEIEGHLTGLQYCAILENVMLPSVTARFENNEFIFMHDRSPIHTSRVARECIVRNGIQVIDWPPKGCDINPVENLFAELCRILNDYDNIPRNRAELSERIQTGWEEMARQPGYIASICRNIPQRLGGIIENNGYFSRY